MWIPKHIQEEEDFLDPILVPIRNYVANDKSRRDNITLELHVFENRCLLPVYSEIINEFVDEDEKETCFRGSWEIIGTYLSEERDKKGRSKTYRIDTRPLKRMFLRGFLEVTFNDQKGIYLPKNNPDSNVGNYKYIDEYFFKDESLGLDSMKRVWNHFLGKPKQDRRRVQFLDHANSRTRGVDEWNVFVDSKLYKYYMGHRNQGVETKIIDKLNEEFISINFLKTNETNHAVLANFYSFQRFLDKAYNQRDQGGDMDINKRSYDIDDHESVFQYIGGIKDKASIDTTIVSSESRQILEKIANGTELSTAENDQLKSLSKQSVKIRIMARLAKHKSIERRTFQYLCEKDNEGLLPDEVVKDDILIDKPITNAMSDEKRTSKINIIYSIDALKDIPKKILDIAENLLWIPEWETTIAGGYDKKSYTQKIGNMTITYSLKPISKLRQSYLLFSYSIKSTKKFDVVIQFINPTTKELYYEHATKSNTTKEIKLTESKLGFMPESGEIGIYFQKMDIE